MKDPVIKNLRPMKDSHAFLDGSQRSTEKLPSLIIGRGVYKPGWRWSKHAGPQTNQDSANHIGYIESGSMVIKSAEGVEKTVKAGDFFEVQPGHDAWVVGEEPCIALDFEIEI